MNNEEFKKLVQAEEERLRKMLGKPTVVGIKNIQAVTGTIPQRRCKACGDYIDNSFKGRLCSSCFFKFKNARRNRGYKYG